MPETAFVVAAPAPSWAGAGAGAGVRRNAHCIRKYDVGGTRIGGCGGGGRAHVRHGGQMVRMASSPSRWKGEWLCVDCGYIYKPGRKVKFEDLNDDWVCPQCNAPKRRFAKKAGKKVQDTAGTSNTPIIVFSIVGVLLVIALGIWATTSL